MSRFAESTSVSVEKSRGEIERTLQRYGANSFMYGYQGTRAVVQFDMHGRRIKFELPLPDIDAEEFTHFKHGGGKLVARKQAAVQAVWEQACRQRWRALNLCIKAKLESVEAQISTFESEFLANIMLPDGKSIGSWMIPQIAHAYESKKMPPMLSGPKA